MCVHTDVFGVDLCCHSPVRIVGWLCEDVGWSNKWTRWWEAFNLQLKFCWLMHLPQSRVVSCVCHLYLWSEGTRTTTEFRYNDYILMFWLFSEKAQYLNLRPMACTHVSKQVSWSTSGSLERQMTESLKREEHPTTVKKVIFLSRYLFSSGKVPQA